MIKYLKDVANMDCVKEHGWRHFAAHVLGIHRVSLCCSSIGQWATGFKKGE